MKVEQICRAYTVNLDKDEDILTTDDVTLMGRLDELPIYDIEYNGHFGPYIFYSVNVEDDTPSLHLSIISICQERLQEIRDEDQHNR